MNIVQSALSASTQADGRQQVHEVHTDLIGLTHTVDYLAEAADDLNANLGGHASQLGLDLAAAEVQSNVQQVLEAGSQAIFSFNYSAVADTIDAGRSAFPDATPLQALMLADFLLSQSDSQLETLFALTSTQIASLRGLPTLDAQASAITSLVET